MQIKPKTKASTKRSFTWEIASTNISFMQTNELQAARDGSQNDCSKVSPLEQPRKKATRRAAK